jgi:hypothetical protein
MEQILNKGGLLSLEVHTKRERLSNEYRRNSSAPPLSCSSLFVDAATDVWRNLYACLTLS